MGKLLSIVLGITVLAFIAYKVMYGHMPTKTDEDAAPAQRLEGAQNAAKRIEGQQQDQVNKADIPSD